MVIILFCLFFITLCLHFIYKDEKQLKDEVGTKVLVYEKDIKDKWKKYFYKLFNDGYEMLSG